MKIPQIFNPIARALVPAHARPPCFSVCSSPALFGSPVLLFDAAVPFVHSQSGELLKKKIKPGGIPCLLPVEAGGFRPKEVTRFFG